MREEIWKPISGYIEEISSHGRIRRGTNIIEPSKKPEGYLYITLSKNRKRRNFYIHRLVAEAFIPNPENKPQVNHKIEGEEGKSINIVCFNDDGSVDEERTTIEWCDAKYNNNYGTKPERLKGKAINRKETSKEVIQLSLDGLFIKEYPSQQEVKRQLGLKGVSSCCREKQTSAGGYIFILKSDYNEEYVKKRVEMYRKTFPKLVVQYTLDGEFVKEWVSMNEIQRQLGFNQGSISNCCNGRCKSVYGFLWKYK